MCVSAGTQDFTDTVNLLNEGNRQITSGTATAITYLRRGGTMQSMRSLQAAVEDYTRAITFDPPLPADKLAIAYDSRSRTLVQLNRHDEAITDSLTAIRLMPDHGAYYTNLGHARLWAGDVEAALADLTTALRLDAEEWWAHGYRGQAHLLLGNPELAIIDLTVVIERAQPASSLMYWTRARAYLTCGGFREAEADCTSGLQSDRHDWHLWMWRAYARYRLGNLEGALGDYMEGLILNREPGGLLGRALVYRELGIEHAAIADMVEFVKLHPSGPLAALGELADTLHEIFAAPVAVAV